MPGTAKGNKFNECLWKGLASANRYGCASEFASEQGSDAHSDSCLKLFVKGSKDTIGLDGSFVRTVNGARRKSPVGYRHGVQISLEGSATVLERGESEG